MPNDECDTEKNAEPDWFDEYVPQTHQPYPGGQAALALRYMARNRQFERISAPLSPKTLSIGRTKNT